MLEIVHAIVLAVLLANVMVALVVIARRPGHTRWLLAILLTGTTGSAVTVVLMLMIGGAAERFVDVVWVLLALAALTAAVRRADTATDPAVEHSTTAEHLADAPVTGEGQR